MKSFIFKGAIFGFSLLFWTPILAAKGGSLVDPTPARFLVKTPDFSAVSSQWKGSLGFAQWWVNLAAQNKLHKDIAAMVKASLKDATPTVEWTGQGVLYELVVATNPNAERAGWYVATIVGGSPIKIGVGTTPEQVLYANLSRDQLKPGIPDGFTLDPQLSGYFWVSKLKNGRISDTGIPGGTVKALYEKMEKHYGELEWKYQSEKMSNKEVWVQIARSAKQRLANISARNHIDDALATVAASESAVADINAKLKTALEKAERADEALMTLRIMKTVFDVGSFVQAAMKSTGEPAKRFDGATTPDAVFRRVEEFRDENVTLRNEYTVKVTNGANDLQNALDNLWQKIQPAHPPKDAVEPLLLKRKP
jgi:hypothetical protein